MKLAISGTYSSGKTRTVMALAHLTGYPRTLAKTIREIMPDAVPGKRLAQCTPAEFLQLAMRRHSGRAVHEALLKDNFVSDGSSLQEWIYAAARVKYGMNPNQEGHLEPVPRSNLSPEMIFFEQVTNQYGHAFKQHVKNTFDVFIHLKNELPLKKDGHRPMNKNFRDYCDEMLLKTLDELKIPYHIISGSINERLSEIAKKFNLPITMSIEEAINLADREYSMQDFRFETERR
ncbi:putative atp/GTP-binding protein, mmyx [Xenorhabdus bovienii str. oregonense]|uniref:Putative atp/GTP-binding protein, mmyx n=1 Tax=Xenorhabdus bovienii str. oregonense TaxID=1398202 RepID=A0A077P332_XENBV|nr:AAA family ATPase [Xenorhabdus bovienii]CDH05455.1 putative atp/GTP-binding protein, mmyx [Xenorhabdus bovienii str. oregonense]